VDPSRVPGEAREPSQPVRGRDAELTALAAHLDQLRSGIGTVALVEGGAGMGKSRLLEEVATMARRLSIRVGSGVAEPCDTVVQLSALMDALFDGPSPILERAALRDAHTSPEQRYWLLQDLEALLQRAALEAPLLVCLDDMQWADSGTAAARFDDQLAAMVAARDEGLIAGIGLSNVSLEQLRHAAQGTEIVCVQNLFHLADRTAAPLLDACLRQGIAFVPFCPLGWPRGQDNPVLTSPVVAQTAARLGITPAQAALQWLLQLAPNVLLIPGTGSVAHLRENLAAEDTTLDDQALRDLDRVSA
jgi:hypothetical protein